MRTMLMITVLFACASCFNGCGAEPEPASAPPAAPSSTATVESTSATDSTPPTQPQSSGELKVLTAEDMEKLQKERKEQIDRSTPLGEEKDAVQDLQKKR